MDLMGFFAWIIGLLGFLIAIYQTILAHKSYMKDKQSKKLKTIEEQVIQTRETESNYEKDIPKSQDTLVKETNEFVRQFKEPILGNIISSFDEHNLEMLNIRYREKYASSIFLTRKIISDHFNNFFKSDKSILVLTGKAGTGKSVFICDLVKNNGANTNIWLQDCANLKMSESTDINTLIGRSLGFNIPILDIFELLKKKFPQNKLLIIFDAINEFTRKEELLEKIADFVNALNTPDIKILVTCRVPIWNSLRRFLTIPVEKEFHTSGPNSYVNIEIFNESESEKAYNLYKDYFKLRSSFQTLSDQVKHLISQPLFLKLTAESFEGNEIPKILILHDVFLKYILKCLGKEELESVEYKILHRSIKLMYDNAVRELRLSILKNDIEVGPYILLDNQKDPYLHLIDEGLLSQKNLKDGFLQVIEVVYVTYERVFEFLLADLIIGNLNELEILKQLEIAHNKMFSQLRGAVELAVSFSIISGKSNISLIINLARLNRPDSRQFLCDVIQTIYQSGNSKLVFKIIEDLCRHDEPQSMLLAIQVSYQLCLDDKLIELALINDQFSRDIASLYIYERWNKARLCGNLDDGYKIVRNLVSRINLKFPKASYNALSAFFSISINMCVHVIDDPKSLQPLIEITTILLKRIPGLIPNARQNMIINKLSEKTGQIIIDILISYVSKIMDDANIYRNIFTDKDAKRALLDVGSLINLDNLTNCKDKVLKLINWNNPAVSFSSRSVLTCQVFLSPEVHLDLLKEIFENSDQPLQTRINVLHAIIYGLISRLLNDKEIEKEVLVPLVNNVLDLTQEYIETYSTLTDSIAFSDDDRKLCFGSLQYLFFGVVYLDSYLLRMNGLSQGASFLDKYFFDSIIKEPITLDLIIWSIEKVAYQGFGEYSILTLSNPKFLEIWYELAYMNGLNALSNIRSIFQDQFDNILQSDDEYKELWNKVKALGSFPNPKELWEISYGIWIMVGTAINPSIMKISGLILLDLVSSEKSDEFIKRVVRTLLSIIVDPDIIDIAHIQYGLAHDTNWNLFERLSINKTLLNIKPEIHEQYKLLSEAIVKNYGRGILYDDRRMI